MKRKDLKNLIIKVRKHINILESYQRGEIRKKEKHEELEGSSDRRAETATQCKKQK